LELPTKYLKRLKPNKKEKGKEKRKREKKNKKENDSKNNSSNLDRFSSSSYRMPEFMV
jgi:hypothetical protein